MKCKNCRNLFKRLDDDDTLYDWCGKVVDCPDRDLDRDCKYYQAATNADKIRAMTDEELADLLHHWWLGDTDYFKTYCFKCKEKYLCHDDCLLDWLKQEAK